MALTRKIIHEILAILDELYPEVHCELNHSNPFELLIATILSAQSTDRKVNELTPHLFAVFPTPSALANADILLVEEAIHELGLYRSKASNIIAASQMLMDRFEGEVPDTLEELTVLPGVGRKTANVVLANAFNIPAFAVDTHVFRVSNRIGLAESDDVSGTEQQLMKKVPKELWIRAHHWLIYHGRRVCIARNPKCSLCALTPYCKYYRASSKRVK